MNLAIRGISANLGVKADDTFANDQHPDLKADFIIANPPFNLKAWRAVNELTDDSRWSGYEVPPTGNANYAWILHMVSKLSNNGTAGFLLANGALAGEGSEKAIRRKLIENQLVEAILVLPMRMFYTTDISVTLWILNKNKKAHTVERGDVNRKYRDRESDVLFMDLRKLGVPFQKKYIQFSKNNLRTITSTFHAWQEVGEYETYKNVPEFCYSAKIEEIRCKDYSLAPSKYLEFIDRDENVDFNDKMIVLQSEFKKLLKNEAKSKTDLLDVFKELGYEIKL